MKSLILALCCVLTSCAMYPIGRLPADKEGALVMRCREVKGWFGRDSHWLMVAWVWSKTGAMPDNPGEIEIDPDCNWRISRPTITPPSATAVAPAHPKLAVPPHPAAEPQPQ